MRIIAVLAVSFAWATSEPVRAQAPLPATTRAATATANARPHAAVLGPEYPEFAPPPGRLQGTLVSIGSPFVSSLINRWADVLDNSNPDLVVNVSGWDSAQGPPALTAGTAQLAAMIRRISDKERAAFHQKFGYPPTELIVAIDAMAVYVEKTNPIGQRGLTLRELDSIFSPERRRGGAPARTWGDLGLGGDWDARPITLYGVPPDRAPHIMFSDVVMEGAGLNTSMQAQPTYSSIVQAIAADPAGIGYCSIFYSTRRTRAIPIRADDGKLVLPTLENCRNGTYPLARPLYVYINKAPGKSLDPLTAGFVSLILSRQGQQIVADGGNFPLVADQVVTQRRLLEP
jgi:phosphate transport system substrate-binding protein